MNQNIMDDKFSTTNASASMIKNYINKIHEHEDIQTNFCTPQAQNIAQNTCHDQLTDYQISGTQQQNIFSINNCQYDNNEQSQANYSIQNYNYCIPELNQLPNYNYLQTTNNLPSYDSNQIDSVSSVNLNNQQTSAYSHSNFNYQQQNQSYFNPQWQNTAVVNQQIYTPYQQPQKVPTNQYVQNDLQPSLNYNQLVQQNSQDQILNINTSYDQSLINAQNSSHIQNQQLISNKNLTLTEDFKSVQQMNNLNPMSQQLNKNIDSASFQNTKPVLASPKAGTIPLSIIKKLKQKIASHSNKVIASIKSTNAPTDFKLTTNGLVTDTQKLNFCPVSTQTSFNKEKLTENLTEEEKQIIGKVLEKDEQFQRETISSTRVPLIDINGINQTGSSHNILNHDLNSIKIEKCGFCLKDLNNNDLGFTCSDCSKFFCEDCRGNTDDKNENKLWCRSCQRRSTETCIIVNTNEDNSNFQVNTYANQQRRRYTMCNENKQDQKFVQNENLNTSLKFIKHLEPKNYQIESSQNFTSFENENKNIKEIDLRNVPLDKNLSFKTNQIQNQNNYQEILQRHSSMSHRQSITKRPSLTNIYPLNYSQKTDSKFTSKEKLLALSKLPEKTYSVSESSLEDNIDSKNWTQNDFNKNDSLAHNYSRNSVDFVTCKQTGFEKNEKLAVCSNYEHPDVNQQKIKQLNQDFLAKKQVQQNLYTTIQPGNIRRQSDSQGSEGSEQLENSLTLSSPEYFHTPRQSADSENLGLPSVATFATQRRSIPSFFIDPAADSNLSVLKDNLNRRNSVGRTLPRIPVEQSRSLLEIPQGRTCSTHSLDLPNQGQPRRASAPEGENIKIIIDDVDSTAGTRKKQIERVVLYRDQNSRLPVTSQDFGIIVCGGKVDSQDGQLFCYVSFVKPGSCADKVNIKQMDKILQWNRQSLINMTFEQVTQIISSSGNEVELLIEPYTQEEKRVSAIHQKRRLSQGIMNFNSFNSVNNEFKTNKSNIIYPTSSLSSIMPLQSQNILPQIQQTQIQNINQNSVFKDNIILENQSDLENLQQQNIKNNFLATTNISQNQSNLVPINSDPVPIVSSNRRVLPRIPEPVNNNFNSNSVNIPKYPSVKQNQVLLNCLFDSNSRNLIIKIISTHINRINPDSFCFAQVRLLPFFELGYCKTELSKTLEWNEELIFKTIPAEELSEMALEISFWEKNISALPNQLYINQQPKLNLLGETIIPLQYAIYQNTDWWPLLTPSSNFINSNSNKNEISSSYFNATSHQSNLNSFLTTQLPDRSSSAEYLSINTNQLQDLKIDNKHLITESKSVPSSRRNSGNNPSITSSINFHQNFHVMNTNYSQNSIINSQTINQRPSSSIALTNTNTYQQNLNNCDISKSALAINQPNFETIQNNFSKYNQSFNTDQVSNNLNSKLINEPKNCFNVNNSNFLNVKDKTENYNIMRRKSSSALSSGSHFNRTFSSRSNISINKNILNTNKNESLNSLSSNNLAQNIKTKFQNITNFNLNQVSITANEIIKNTDSLISNKTVSTEKSENSSNLQKIPKLLTTSPKKEIKKKALSISANSFSSQEDISNITSDTKTEIKSSLSLIKTNSTENGNLDKIKVISDKEEMGDAGEIELLISVKEGYTEIKIIQVFITHTKEDNLKPDTYVKIYLEKSDKIADKNKTKVVKNSFDPVFNETFKYTLKQFQEDMFCFTLWKKKKKNEKKDIIGRLRLKINLNPNDKPIQKKWKLIFLNEKSKTKFIKQPNKKVKKQEALGEKD